MGGRNIVSILSGRLNDLPQQITFIDLDQAAAAAAEWGARALKISPLQRAATA